MQLWINNGEKKETGNKCVVFCIDWTGDGVISFSPAALYYFIYSLFLSAQVRQIDQRMGKDRLLAFEFFAFSQLSV